MQIDFFCPRWGSEHLSWDVFFAKVIASGYNGVEFGIPAQMLQSEIEDVYNLAGKNKLKLIPQHWDTNYADINQHFDAYVLWFDKLKSVKPDFVNSQTGKDYFSFDQNSALIKVASDYTAATGTRVFHETHRGKFSFAAHITADYLTRLPSLMLTLDMSHWVNVAESFLDDQYNAMQLAISRTAHIHSRVGHPQGAQITDPRAPECREALEKHLFWWDEVVEKRKLNGNSGLTITCEFGPEPYMTTLPFTSQPISNQWEINEYMLNFLKERYSS